MQDHAEKDQTNTEVLEVRIRVDFDKDPENPRVVTDPNPCYIRPGVLVQWTCESGPFAIHFEPISPLIHRRLRAPAGQTIREKVRDIILPGQYQYFVAVLHEGLIYTEDPQLIDDNEDEVRPPLPPSS